MTYGAGKMSPVGRRRPRSRPRPHCRSRCSAPPAGPPGSAGRAGGAPTMPRAPARHIHRPPLTAGPPRGPARSITVPHAPLTVSPRSTHGSPHDPSRLGHRCRDRGGSQGPSFLSSRPHGLQAAAGPAGLLKSPVSAWGWALAPRPPQLLPTEPLCTNVFSPKISGPAGQGGGFALYSSQE